MFLSANITVVKNMIASYEDYIEYQSAIIEWYCEHYNEYRAYPSRVKMMCDTMVDYRKILTRYRAQLEFLETK